MSPDHAQVLPTRWKAFLSDVDSLLRASVEDGRLLVIMTGTGQVVAEHVLVAPGEASVLDDHYGGPRAAPRRAVRPKTAAEKTFCALGPVAEAFITAAAAGHTRLGPELAELNTLRAAHGEPEFLAALSRAVAFGRWHATDVRTILAAGPGTAHPWPAGPDDSRAQERLYIPGSIAVTGSIEWLIRCFFEKGRIARTGSAGHTKPPAWRYLIFTPFPAEKQ